MDQATIIGYALGYVAVVITVLVMFLPFFISFGLLLLLAAAVRLVVLLLTTVSIWAYKRLVGLLGPLAGKLQHSRRSDELVPH